jgi:hypothetical protein
VTVAKDVKVQVEFNPAKVGAYRLIGAHQGRPGRRRGRQCLAGERRPEVRRGGRRLRDAAAGLTPQGGPDVPRGPGAGLLRVRQGRARVQARVPHPGAQGAEAQPVILSWPANQAASASARGGSSSLP